MTRLNEFWNSSIIRKTAAKGSLTYRLKGINGDMLIDIKEEVIYLECIYPTTIMDGRIYIYV